MSPFYVYVCFIFFMIWAQLLDTNEWMNERTNESCSTGARLIPLYWRQLLTSIPGYYYYYNCDGVNMLHSCISVITAGEEEGGELAYYNVCDEKSRGLSNETRARDLMLTGRKFPPIGKAYTGKITTVIGLLQLGIHRHVLQKAPNVQRVCWLYANTLRIVSEREKKLHAFNSTVNNSVDFQNFLTKFCRIISCSFRKFYLNRFRCSYLIMKSV